MFYPKKGSVYCKNSYYLRFCIDYISKDKGILPMYEHNILNTLNLYYLQLQPYHVEYTSFHLICLVKQHWAIIAFTGHS